MSWARTSSRPTVRLRLPERVPGASQDVADRDEATATLILGRGIDATVRYWFASRQLFSVRSKERLLVIRQEDPKTERLIEQALLAPSMALRAAAARDLAQSVIGNTGFFEWDSGPSEAVPS